MTITATKPRSCFKIVDRSKTKAPSCLKQLTVWVKNRADVQFAIYQLDKYRAPWALKQDIATGQCAVFIPGESGHDDPA